MGKRSSFERRERDFYPTPMAAVEPLIPHLPMPRPELDYVPFWEPCAGDAALIKALSALWPDGICTLATDIEPHDPIVVKRDALDCYPAPFDLTITNPPWSRDKASGYLLHRMIEHFSDMRPTWLLFDADWAYTKQSIPYMPRLRKIVPVGRLKWIPGSRYSGKDNCAWYLFDKPSDQPTEFDGRAA